MLISCCGSEIITPYRRERYHLSEYSRNPLNNARELFNICHASLRNAIERAFGVLKKCFPIILSSIESHYRLKALNDIIFACCILHNYLRGEDPNDELFTEVDEELQHVYHDERSQYKKTRMGEAIRYHIAAYMWATYNT